MTVDNMEKIEAIKKIKKTFNPSELIVAIDRFEHKPPEFQEQIKKMFRGPQFHKKQCTFLSNCLEKESGVGATLDVEVGGKGLLVICDYSIPIDCYEDLDVFTILFVSPRERAKLKGVKELNALSYVYFNGGELHFDCTVKFNFSVLMSNSHPFL